MSTEGNTYGLPERVWSRVEPTGDGCWRWLGGPQLWWEGRLVPAHRLIHEALIGEIPAGWFVRRTCALPSCVRPEHLEAVSQAEAQHRTTLPVSNRSGVRGVHWRSRERRWRVRVKLNGQAHDGGYFVELADAERAVVALRERLWRTE